MGLTIAAIVAGAPEPLVTPTPTLLIAAYCIVGTQAGGSLLRSSLAEVASVLPVVLGAIASMIIGCFITAIAITQLTPTPVADAYLATTPGGIYVVLAFATEADASPSSSSHRSRGH